MRRRVLVTARAFWESGQAGRSLLEQVGFEVIHSTRSGPLSKLDLIAQLQNCGATIASSEPLDAEVFAACPDLRIIARCGVGIDSVDLQAATAARVLVTNTPGAMTDAVADYTFALLLGIVRKIPAGAQCMLDGGWSEFRGLELTGRSLGLIGLGAIGQAVMRRALGFGLKMLAYEPSESQRSAARLLGPVEFLELDALFAASDFLSVHAPNVAATRHLVNAHRLSLMKPSAYLINTARGALVDQAALVTALDAGQLAGAALDVFEQEPLPQNSQLRRHPKLLLTPHNAFNTLEAATRMSDLSAEPIVDFASGRIPRFVCNPEVLPFFKDLSCAPIPSNKL